MGDNLDLAQRLSFTNICSTTTFVDYVSFLSVPRSECHVKPISKVKMLKINMLTFQSLVGKPIVPLTQKC